jgi:hypothetical protein
MTEKYTVEEIWYKNGGYLTLDNEQLRGLVALALSKVPKKIADRVVEECIFLMPSPEMMGFFLSKRVQEGRNAIVLSEKLLEEDQKDTILTILHEVGHFYLNHKSPILDMLSEQEDRKQEEDSDRWARQWIEDTTA